jgi:hypothetical protein
LIYGLTFAAAYAVLVVPQALRNHTLVEAFEDGSVLIVIAFLSDWSARVDRRALELNQALQAPRFGLEHIPQRILERWGSAAPLPCQLWMVVS